MTTEEVRLGGLVTFQRGFDITQKDQVEGAVPVYSSGGLSSYHNVHKVKAPGIIIGRKGTLGTVFYAEQDYWPHDTTLWVKSFKGNDPRFIYYFLKTLRLERFDAGAANPTLNRNHIHSLKVSVPVAKYRTPIASILSAYDELIDNNNQRITILEQMAEEIYKEWFVRVRFPDHEQTPTVHGLPKGWKKIPLIDVLEVLSGGTPKTAISEYWNGEIPFFSPADYNGELYCFNTESYITSKGLKNCTSRLFPEDTIIITARGTVGNIVLTGLPMAMNQSCFALKAKLDLTTLYIYQLIKNTVATLKQIANGATFDAITIRTFEQTKAIVPSAQLRLEYDKNVQPLFGQIKILQKKNKILQQTRDLLLPRLISGKLSVEHLLEVDN